MIPYEPAYERIVWHNEPSILTPLNETNMNKMDLALNTIDERVVALSTIKADESEVQQLLESVTYNSNTGVFTFTWKNGSTYSVDLNIEKIPVSFSMSPQGVITMTTADGTQYTADVGALIKLYTFVDSSEINFTVTTDSSGNKTITASIVAGSITGEKLQPNYLADCLAAKSGAETAESNAQGYAINANASALESEGFAVGEQNGVPVTESSPYYHNNAQYYCERAESFTPEGYAQLVDDVDELQDEMSDIYPNEVTDNEPYTLRQGKGDMVDMELVGGSFAWNQLVQNGNFASTSNWTAKNSASISASGNELTIETSSTQYSGATQNITFIKDHVYLAMCDMKSTSVNVHFGIVTGSYKNVKPQTANTYYRLSVIQKMSVIANYGFIGFENESSSVETIKVKNVNLIDLTQMFGPTIADAIYAMEQATTGAGVAFFRKYFPNAYYAYDTGSIQSVNVASRKVVGKNLLGYGIALPYTQNGITISTNEKNQLVINGTTSSDFIISNVFSAKLKTGEQYRLTKQIVSGTGESLVIVGTTPSTDSYYGDAQGSENIGGSLRNSCSLGLYFTSGNKTFKDYVLAYQVEYGIESTAYEPYESHIANFDATKQLRGIPSIVNNKLVYDGDIWNAKGITRKYGIVDLGTLTWDKSLYADDDYHFRSADISGVIKKPSSNSEVANIICTNYYACSSDTSYAKDRVIFVQTSGRVCVHDRSYNTYTENQFKTAMNGVYLVYELATPTTESAEPYQNPQRAFANGTEEFVDYGVESSTRDVSIPCGHNSTYKSSDVIQPLEDYVDGATSVINSQLSKKSDISAIGTDESGRTTASKAYAIGEHFYKDGKFCTAKTAIASGATFTLNTNYEETTISDELNPDVDIVTTGIVSVSFTKSGRIVTAYIPTISSQTIDAWGSVDICNIPQKYQPLYGSWVVMPRQQATTYIPVYINVDNSTNKLKLNNQSSGSVTTGVVMATTITYISANDL